MSKQRIFTCGHAYTAENIIGVTNLRCKACQHERQARARSASAQAAHEAELERQNKVNLTKLSKLRLDEPVQVGDPSVEGIARASKALLRAIYLSHPYVFDAAERSGRQVVRPF